MNRAFVDYYRCPDQLADFKLIEDAELSLRPGYFRFGHEVVCYGKTTVDCPAKHGEQLPDLFATAETRGSTCFLPFCPTEVADNLRQERYVSPNGDSLLTRLSREFYYLLRPALPVGVRRHLQRARLRGWDSKPFPRWPVDRGVDRFFERLMKLALAGRRDRCIPFIWFWPEGRSAALLMTHDVETSVGLNRVAELMDLNDSFSMKSSFQLIPEARYDVDEDVLRSIRDRGFEINVHDLTHDGHLFDDHQRFLTSAARINDYAQRFGSRGFRAGVLYRNLEWYDAFSFSYDMSVPNVGHLDPQPGGCCTVMPYFIGKILEIPLTTTQDYSLFNILGTYSLDLWKAQVTEIVAQNGLLSFNIHPDYIGSSKGKSAYVGLLEMLRAIRQARSVWCTLPGEVDRWWRQRHEMRLVLDGNRWSIEGPGADRARVAFAQCGNSGELTYELQ